MHLMAKERQSRIYTIEGESWYKNEIHILTLSAYRQFFMYITGDQV